MKTFSNILITCLLIVGCIFTIGLRLHEYSYPLHEDYEINNSDHEDIVMVEAFKHKEHTHEHAGLACCPCGTCHFKKEEDENHEYNHEFREYSFP